MLDQCVTEDNATATANAGDRILDALWEMLSGVCAVTPSPVSSKAGHEPRQRLEQ